MTVAIFDLDHTLIDTDSDHAWGEFLVEKKVVDPASFKKANDYFYEQYCRGELDLEEYLAFSLKPLADNDAETMHQLREEFVETRICSLIKSKVPELLEKHRSQGHTLLVITATNEFVVNPIIDAIGIKERLAINVEMIDGRYTGNYTGIPTFREGKITRFLEWMKENPGHSLEDSWFYSDSMNDLPLLEKVGNPVAVDADDKLKAIAQERGWLSISLK